jgi:hypothetical protein
LAGSISLCFGVWLCRWRALWLGPSNDFDPDDTFNLQSEYATTNNYQTHFRTSIAPPTPQSPSAPTTLFLHRKKITMPIAAGLLRAGRAYRRLPLAMILRPTTTTTRTAMPLRRAAAPLAAFSTGGRAMAEDPHENETFEEFTARYAEFCHLPRAVDGWTFSGVMLTRFCWVGTRTSLRLSTTYSSCR